MSGATRSRSFLFLGRGSISWIWIGARSRFSHHRRHTRRSPVVREGLLGRGCSPSGEILAGRQEAGKPPTGSKDRSVVRRVLQSVVAPERRGAMEEEVDVEGRRRRWIRVSWEGKSLCLLMHAAVGIGQFRFLKDSRESRRRSYPCNH